MLGKVCLLSVGLAAVLAYVSLEMFRLLMLGYVFEERRFVAETLVAGIALVRFVSLVAAGVGLEVAELAEGLVAAGVPALVGLIAGVGADVLLEVGQLGELPLADLAAVRLDAQVDPRVLAQVGAVRERLATLIALVRLHFSHVQLRVQLQLRLGRKYLKQERKRMLANPC